MLRASRRNFLLFQHDDRREIFVGLRRVASILVLLVAMGASGCGYRVVGKNSTLPSDWKTIAIPAFVNRTSRYRVEQHFTADVIHEFISRTKYRIVQNESAADAVLHGEILTIETSPVLFDAASGQATMMVVTVHAKVSLVGRADEKTAYKNDDMVFRDEYQISSDVKSFFEEENPALERMSRDFASQVVANVLEGF
jgi:outer membrane lipopolysaccharide assembly protein LptE/RlpB